MLKICGSFIYGPLELIFKEALSMFPSNWKKGKIVTLHNKGDKQILKNYPSVSLLPVFQKISERLTFNDFLLENNLVLQNHSGFKPGDSCINQLLSHEICNSFDEDWK